MFESFPIWVNNIIESIILILICIVIYVVVLFVMNTSLKSLSPDSKDYSRKVTTGKLMTSSLKYVMVIVAFTGVLVVCGVEVGTIITGAGLLSIAIGFGAQNLVNDVISGLFIFFEKQYAVGETVEIDKFTGEVISLGFKSTVLQNWVGDIFIIGNGKINSVINYSQADSVAIVKVRVDEGTDLLHVQNIVEDKLPREIGVHDYFIEKPIYKGVTEISSLGIQIMITVKTKPMRHFEGERVVRQEIIKLFEKEQIKFSYPKIKYEGEKNV